MTIYSREIPMVPWEWTHVLKKLHAGGFPEAVIAGGAIRDYLHNKSAKDIDVFVAYRDDADMFKCIADAFGITITQSLGAASCDYIIGNSDVRAICSLNISQCPPVQIIALNNDCTIHDVLHRIDFGLCQVAFDGKRLWLTDGYYEDEEDETITLLRSDNVGQYHRSMLRAARIKAKYPYHKVIVPLWLSEQLFSV